ncbi:MAG: VWA domain-containing protein [Bdellovibrionales bacterium]|nr:VWA domain-containing protein [Bdellovibrionales bacterium]
MSRKIQGAVVFDLTGSMAAVRDEVRYTNCAFIDRLYGAFDKIEIGAIAIGDDPEPGYMMEKVGLSSRPDTLRHFIMTVPNAYGGDGDECYEQALDELSRWSWDPEAAKFVVFIGDAVPHAVSHRKNPGRLDWQVCARRLAETAGGINIFPVHALAYRDYGNFWHELAEIGDAPYLRLGQFRHVENLILGITHRMAGADRFAEFERGFSNVPHDLRESFDALAGRPRTTPPWSGTGGGSRRRKAGFEEVVPPDRFQVLTVTSREKVDCKEFAVEKGLIREPAEYDRTVKSNFYYLHDQRSRETLRPTHHVVIEDLITGEMITGDAAREALGCPYGDSKNIPRNPLPGKRVWFQTKSHNRKFEVGQHVLIDTDGIDEHALTR